VTAAGQTVARYTAFKMGDVVVSGDVNLGIGELTAEIVVKSLDMNTAAAGFARLDWTHAFDLDGDGQYGDLLDPGAELPTPVDLSIDFTSSLEFRLTGSFSGTGEYTYDPDFATLTTSQRRRHDRQRDPDVWRRADCGHGGVCAGEAHGER
jgi:hypothetical protein